MAQSIEGSPGEILSFSISAVDQGDIWQDAIWSISEEREEEVGGTVTLEVIQGSSLQKSWHLLCSSTYSTICGGSPDM